MKEVVYFFAGCLLAAFVYAVGVGFYDMYCAVSE